MGQKLWKNPSSPQLLKFTWDFAVNGGAVGVIALGNLPDSFVITKAYAQCEVAPVGGGTMVVGEDGGGDDDGYFLDLDAIAISTARKANGALLLTAPLTAAEIGDDKAYQVLAAKDGVQMTIASVAYTAGKINFYFEGFQA